ncbi:hypothetical protein JCM11641_000867 [Rhodosporidiobolus odoratus]
MLPHQATWQPPPLPQPDAAENEWFGIAGGEAEWERVLDQEIERRSAHQRLEQTLPAFESFGFSSSQDNSVNGGAQIGNAGAPLPVDGWGLPSCLLGNGYANPPPPEGAGGYGPAGVPLPPQHLSAFPPSIPATIPPATPLPPRYGPPSDPPLPVGTSPAHEMQPAWPYQPREPAATRVYGLQALAEASGHMLEQQYPITHAHQYSPDQSSYSYHNLPSNPYLAPAHPHPSAHHAPQHQQLNTPLIRFEQYWQSDPPPPQLAAHYRLSAPTQIPPQPPLSLTAHTIPDTGFETTTAASHLFDQESWPAPVTSPSSAYPSFYPTSEQGYRGPQDSLARSGGRSLLASTRVIPPVIHEQASYGVFPPPLPSFPSALSPLPLEPLQSSTLPQHSNPVLDLPLRPVPFSAAPPLDYSLHPTPALAAPPPLPAAPPRLSLRDMQPAPAAFDFAASNRVLSSTSSAKRTRMDSHYVAIAPSASSTDSPPSVAPIKPASTGKAGKRVTVDLFTDCVVCKKSLARLILRGKQHEINVPHAAVFTCLSCVEPSTSPSGESPGSEAAPPPPASTSKGKGKVPSFRKKNKRLDERSSLTSCDCCLNDIAVGGVLPTPVDAPPPGVSIKFTVEVVCSSCDDKYRRCTDCGGGGGTRAGTGKWRSKELFLAGRKTCCLNHQRLGSFVDMSYDIYNVRDIPADEVSDVSERCRRIFSNQMLSAICIPEILEQDGAIYKTYAKAQERAHQGWKGFEGLIRDDIEDETSMRRYLGLRTCMPNLRKSAKGREEEEQDKPKKANPVMVKEGREVEGFLIGEYELKLGHLFLAIMCPWDANGEIFDATTLLLGELMRRIDSDVREVNAVRAATGEALLPQHYLTWTMLFFKRESRTLGHLVKKRDFQFLDDYLEAFPETDLTQFPPHRPVYMPAEVTPSWQILMRRQKQYPDGRLDDWNARRASDEERGKKKELKAKQKRLEQQAATAGGGG